VVALTVARAAQNPLPGARESLAKEGAMSAVRQIRRNPRGGVPSAAVEPLRLPAKFRW